MVRRVFFSFHYERDIWRVSQVRNSWVTKPDIEEAGYIDKAGWESLEREGEEAIKRWIMRQLDGTSVTVVLIGGETSKRRWVGYEIDQSSRKGNGMLGIYIHNVKDQNSLTDTKGSNPFDNRYIEQNGQKTYLSQLYPTYDWVNDNGYDNFGDWVEKAAQKAGR
ncbi:MAG TPA: TIR domain-containing protein [Candidatus Bathyarchaeia archaeon]|nr:TIR domain-containing protein [Candidatus Bathyarchaeia archaeon]